MWHIDNVHPVAFNVHGGPWHDVIRPRLAETLTGNVVLSFVAVQDCGVSGKQASESPSSAAQVLEGSPSSLVWRVVEVLLFALDVTVRCQEKNVFVIAHFSQ